MNNVEAVNVKKIKIKIILFAIFILIALAGVFNCLKNDITNLINGDAIYTRLLNYSMPILSQYEDGESENRDKLKNLIMDTLGINIYNPISILEKEMPMVAMSNRNSSKEVKTAEKLNPFKLDDNSVSKVSENNNPTENDLNLSNKVVSNENKDLKKKLDTSKPEVLIYHTHSGEDFVPGGQNNSVITVGAELQKVLQETYGISVIHDKTICTNYTTSYTSSAKIVDKYLSEYKDFKLIIDMHRDSGPNRETSITRMNDENVSKIMFVISKNRKNINENMKLVNSMVDISNKLYPGYCKGIHQINHGINNFNQDKSNNSVLIEIGSDKVKIEEAKATVKYLSRIIAEQLNKK